MPRILEALRGICLAWINANKTTVPMYQSETAPKWIRGTIVGAYQLAITIGLLLAAIVNNSTKDRQDSGSYRIPIAVQFLWSIILVGGYVRMRINTRYVMADANLSLDFSFCPRHRDISSRWTNMSRPQAVLASFVACQSTIQLSLRNWARFKRTISTRCRWASLRMPTASREHLASVSRLDVCSRRYNSLLV